MVQVKYIRDILSDSPCLEFLLGFDQAKFTRCNLVIHKASGIVSNKKWWIKLKN